MRSDKRASRAAHARLRVLSGCGFTCDLGPLELVCARCGLVTCVARPRAARLLLRFFPCIESERFRRSSEQDSHCQPFNGASSRGERVHRGCATLSQAHVGRRRADRSRSLLPRARHRMLRASTQQAGLALISTQTARSLAHSAEIVAGTLCLLAAEKSWKPPSIAIDARVAVAHAGRRRWRPRTRRRSRCTNLRSASSGR